MFMTATSPGVSRSIAAILAVATLLLGGCLRMYQDWNVSRRDAEIRRADAAIAAAGSNAQRAAAYADRADAYTEKARYSRIMKLIPDGEYSRLFDLAVQDYNQAIGLDPRNAEMYFRRGNAYYSRAALDMIYAPSSPFLSPAKADFSIAVERNPRHVGALDMLGLTDASMRDWTQAIADFTRETALEPSMRFRLSDAYCNRGSIYAGQKKDDPAISDLNQAIQIRTASDPCECEPYNPLLAIYLTHTHEYDKAQEVAAMAQRSKKWIAPEYLAQLKASSAARQ
jgi:tetratricopeptide (TPR) repeat protein